MRYKVVISFDSEGDLVRVRNAAGRGNVPLIPNECTDVSEVTLTLTAGSAILNYYHRPITAKGNLSTRRHNYSVELSGWLWLEQLLPPGTPYETKEALRSLWPAEKA